MDERYPGVYLDQMLCGDDNSLVLVGPVRQNLKDLYTGNYYKVRLSIEDIKSYDSNGSTLMTGQRCWIFQLNGIEITYFFIFTLNLLRFFSRLRCLLRHLRKGEISAEILHKNLYFAAKVLETAFTDEEPKYERRSRTYCIVARRRINEVEISILPYSLTLSPPPTSRS